jgi:transposase
MEITTIGVDLAKNVFQVHGVDERGKTVLSKHLGSVCSSRAPKRSHDVKEKCGRKTARSSARPRHCAEGRLMG